MASKRKSEPVKKTAKRGKKKNDDSFDSDLSDDFGEEVGNGNGAAAPPVTFDERAVLPKLPAELLASRDREPGKLLINGDLGFGWKKGRHERWHQNSSKLVELAQLTRFSSRWNVKL